MSVWGGVYMKRLILASASPRRRELIKKVSADFECIAADVEETVPDGTETEMIPEHLASLKARKIAYTYPDAVVVGCDTIVIANGEMLGKPKDEKDAYRMLSMMSGIQHTVITGVCIINNGSENRFSEVSRVTFKELTDEKIREYISTGEPMDKAGAYGIQTRGSELVEKYEGDYYNIIGLPVDRLKKELEHDNIIFG